VVLDLAQNPPARGPAKVYAGKGLSEGVNEIVYTGPQAGSVAETFSGIDQALLESAQASRLALQE